jgi:flavin reductase (DIM6/NTAB) family NADH-FMN oxidoreductase RutF
MKDLFHEVDPTTLPDNTFTLIEDEWMLITAGNLAHYNTMTANWGGFGILWRRKICWCVIRPHRYTYQFMESAPAFSLSFFTKEYKKALDLCGAKSGRDIDKAAATGLTPFETCPGIVSFTQARLIIECQKIYYQDLDPQHFLDPAIGKNYPDKDYHRMYLGEIIRCLAKDE